MDEAVKFDNQKQILKAQEGDMFAFRALVDVHKEQAVRIAYSITGNLADAQDIAQEAFIKVYKKLTSFRLESSFSTWLYRIVVNLGYDFLKKRKHSKLIFNNDTVASQEQAEDSKSLSPAESMISKELGAKIKEALTFLPEKQQVAFILKYKKDMKIREIAEVMSVSESTVKMHLYRAINGMQKKLKAYVR